MELVYYLLIALLVWNLVVFFLYAADKSRARRGGRRISERSLLLAAFLGGGIGAAAGVFLLRHKTRHLKFCIIVPLCLIITVAALVFIIYNCGLNSQL